MIRDDENGVVVIGAGVAGLSAARSLAAHAIPVTLIEAAERIGGRAWTTRPALLGGTPFDHGATWLHAAHRNPLVNLAQPGDHLRDSDAAQSERIFVGDRPATEEQVRAYERAWGRLEVVVAPALAGPDTSLAAAMAPMADEFWAPTVALWEGAIIAAADADVLSLQDWRRNALDGRNLQPAAGIGAFVEARLAAPAALGTHATLIDWGGPGVSVETNRGTIRAAAAIVTVSTGVLAAGAIQFRPVLPDLVEAAIHRLPMGLLGKVAIPAPDPAAFGLTADTLLLRAGGQMTFDAWPSGRPYVTGFMGGALAWSLAERPAEAAALARDELGRMLGGRWSEQALPTDWGTDPLHRGAYAYARPGDVSARGNLAGAFPAERLLFAGEGYRTDGLAGTVAGAFLSGAEAAAKLAAARRPPLS